jgi:hypothetical protein
MEGFDHNVDGILDEVFLTGDDSVLSAVHIDRNFDGKIDFKMEFFPSGHIKSAEEDTNFDGYFETQSSFVDNQPNALRIDTDANGEFDLIQYFKAGVATKSYIINPDTGLRAAEFLYTLEKISKSFKDTDLDGKYDLECEYNFFEDEVCSDIAR